MEKTRTMLRRRQKTTQRMKLVVYLSPEENQIVERAADVTGRSKSAFGAEVVLKEAHKIVNSLR
jgi:uncharacterized protein (DUF1778 family)